LEDSVKLYEDIQLGTREEMALTNEYHDLACFYQEHLDRESATHNLLKAIKIKDRILGASHVSTTRELTFLADVYENTDRLEDAEQLLRRALKIRKHALGDHEDVAGWCFSVDNCFTVQQSKSCLTATLFSLAAVLERLSGVFEVIEPLLRESLRIRYTVLGHDHAKTLATREALSSLYKSACKYDKSHALFYNFESV